MNLLSILDGQRSFSRVPSLLVKEPTYYFYWRSCPFWRRVDFPYYCYVVSLLIIDIRFHVTRLKVSKRKHFKLVMPRNT